MSDVMRELENLSQAKQLQSTQPELYVLERIKLLLHEIALLETACQLLDSPSAEKLTFLARLRRYSHKLAIDKANKHKVERFMAVVNTLTAEMFANGLLVSITESINKANSVIDPSLWRFVLSQSFCIQDLEVFREILIAKHCFQMQDLQNALGGPHREIPTEFLDSFRWCMADVFKDALLAVQAGHATKGRNSLMNHTADGDNDTRTSSREEEAIGDSDGYRFYFRLVVLVILAVMVASEVFLVERNSNDAGDL